MNRYKTSNKPGPSRKHRLGLLVVLSSPSGGGKTTVAGKVLEKDKNIVRSISCTTRKPRNGEKDGRDYFFITRAKFEKMTAQKAFLEWAQVHGNFYGTPRAWVETQLRKGKDVLFVIDVQGGRSLRRLYPDCLLLFLKPPSFGVLKKRLISRGANDSQDLRTRLKDARWEVRQGRFYDHQVINNKLGRAVLEVLHLIRRKRAEIKPNP